MAFAQYKGGIKNHVETLDDIFDRLKIIKGWLFLDDVDLKIEETEFIKVFFFGRKQKISIPFPE